jgi:hypothetical protein
MKYTITIQAQTPKYVEFEGSFEDAKKTADKFIRSHPNLTASVAIGEDKNHIICRRKFFNCPYNDEELNLSNPIIRGNGFYEDWMTLRIPTSY